MLSHSLNMTACYNILSLTMVASDPQQLTMALLSGCWTPRARPRLVKKKHTLRLARSELELSPSDRNAPMASQKALVGSVL